MGRLLVSDGQQNNNDMTPKSGNLSVAVVCLAVFALASAQITFSRDWTGGKRSAPQLAIDCGQFTRLCRHFVHELKQAMSAEIPSKRRRSETDKTPLLYDDEN